MVPARTIERFRRGKDRRGARSGRMREVRCLLLCVCVFFFYSAFVRMGLTMMGRCDAVELGYIDKRKNNVWDNQIAIYYV